MSAVVGSVMDGVHVDQRPHSVGGPATRATSTAVRVGRRGHRYQPGAIVEQRLEVLVVERPVLQPDKGRVDRHPALFGGHHPWGDVGVVVELGDHYPISFAPGASERPAQGEGETGHVLPECHRRRVGAP